MIKPILFVLFRIFSQLKDFIDNINVYEKGGAVLSAAFTLQKPILYIGVGQDYPDLKKFSPSEIVKNLLS